MPLRSTIVICAGTVMSAEPSSWVFVSFVSVTVYDASVTPAHSGDSTSMLYGFDGAPNAGDANSAAAATRTKTRYRNCTGSHLRV